MKKLTLFVLAIVFCMVYLVTACYAMDDNSFVQLCGSGSVQAVRNALLQGANPNAKNNEGSSWFGIMLEWFVSPPPGVEIKYEYDGMTALMAAARDNKTPEVTFVLLKAGADPNAKTDDGQTALMFAIRKNTLEVISLLLKASADVNAKEKEGYTVLMEAAHYNENPEVISSLLKAGADINAKADNNYTALMFAAVNNNNPKVIDLLLKAGADVNAKTDKGHTALTLAAANNQNPEIINLLLKAGADINTKANNGKTALDLAREKNNTAVIKVLEPLSYAKILNTDDSETQYQLALKYTTGKGVERDEKKGVELFLKAARNGHQKAKESLALLSITDDGFLALCEIGFAQEIQEALVAGANPNAKNNDGITALMAAAEKNSPKAVSVLLKAGADINAKTNVDKHRASMRATFRGPENDVPLLLANDFDINEKIKDGVTALMLAAAKNKNPKVVSILLKAGADINAKTSEGYTALMLAVANNKNSEVISVLLKGGADANSKILSGTLQGVTVLMIGAVRNTPKVLSTLLRAGADVNAQNYDGRTALMLAVQGNKKNEVVSILSVLLRAGANINAKTRGGMTVLMLTALEDENPEVVSILSLLLKAGADINAKSNGFKTALDFALEKNNTPAIRVLEAAQRGVSLGSTLDKNFKANGAIVGNKVNVRSQPNTSSKVVKQLNAGHPLKVVENNGDWFFIQTASGTEGWVFGKYIKLNSMK